MTVVIYHNPDCGTSRNVVRFAQAAGANPIIIEYLQTGWTKAQLQGLFAAANLTPDQALRRMKSPASALNLLEETDPEVLLDAMVTHPILVNRPFVCSPKGTALCRPSDAVFPLLDLEKGQEFTSETGDLVFKT